MSSGTGLPPWMGLIPLAFGILFLASAIYYEVRFVLDGKEATGQIDRFERPHNSTLVYINYQTDTGEAAQCRQTLLMRERFEVGQNVNLRYLPGDPKMGRITTYFQLWQPLILKLILGLVAIWMAMALFLRKIFGLSEQFNEPPDQSFD